MILGLLWLIMNRLMAFGASRHYQFSIAERYYAKETTKKEFKFWGSCSLGIHNFFLAIRTSHHDLIRSCHFSHLLQNSWHLNTWRSGSFKSKLFNFLIFQNWPKFFLNFDLRRNLKRISYVFWRYVEIIRQFAFEIS